MSIYHEWDCLLTDVKPNQGWLQNPISALTCSYAVFDLRQEMNDLKEQTAGKWTAKYQSFKKPTECTNTQTGLQFVFLLLFDISSYRFCLIFKLQLLLIDYTCILFQWGCQSIQNHATVANFACLLNLHSLRNLVTPVIGVFWLSLENKLKGILQVFKLS